MYDISTNLQNVYTHTSEISLTKVNDINRVKYKNLLGSLYYEKYKLSFGKTK